MGPIWVCKNLSALCARKGINEPPFRRDPERGGGIDEPSPPTSPGSPTFKKTTLWCVWLSGGPANQWCIRLVRGDPTHPASGPLPPIIVYPPLFFPHVHTHTHISPGGVDMQTNKQPQSHGGGGGHAQAPTPIPVVAVPRQRAVFLTVPHAPPMATLNYAWGRAGGPLLHWRVVQLWWRILSEEFANQMNFWGHFSSPFRHVRVQIPSGIKLRASFHRHWDWRPFRQVGHTGFGSCHNLRCVRSPTEGVSGWFFHTPPI